MQLEKEKEIEKGFIDFQKSSKNCKIAMSNMMRKKYNIYLYKKKKGLVK